MKLVIDVPDNIYDAIKNAQTIVSGQRSGKTLLQILVSSVENGKLLPKNHGGLMILSKDKVKENQIDLDFSCQKWINEVGLSNATVAIIEAEKGEEEE